jgi:3-oxoacyl-[acyl-carrier-protein] synthase-3
MEQGIYSVISGSGSYIPTRRISNDQFLKNVFYDRNGCRLEKTNAEIVRQFEKITGIRERRYVTDDLVTSDIAFFAARDALASASVDPESLDYIIVAHNFGDIPADNRRSGLVPSLASRVKHHLQIKNPYTVGIDLPFGCAGWLQGVIQADVYIRAGIAKRVLVVGAETLSRVCDPHDRDSMIYADGAGAVILEATESEHPVGILAHVAKSYTDELAYVLQMGKSSNPDYFGSATFLKMNGRKLYEGALKTVPITIKECIDKAGLSIEVIDKVLIHQANEKMDDAILSHLFGLYGIKSPPADIMPMTISLLGNSSVATLPTLYDLISKGNFEKQTFTPGSHIVFASVGAGVNMNALLYKIA